MGNEDGSPTSGDVADGVQNRLFCMINVDNLMIIIDNQYFNIMCGCERVTICVQVRVSAGVCACVCTRVCARVCACM